MEIIARISTSVAGPAYFIMASEVATLKLMRALGIPAPKVLFYSRRMKTDVGCEYILMERAKLVSLLSARGKMKRKERGQVLTQLIDIDLKMMSLNFSGYG